MTKVEFTIPIHSVKDTIREEAENTLLNQLASTSATVWSPQADNRSIQALSDLLATAKEQSNA